jgi:hypothetical protein
MTRTGPHDQGRTAAPPPSPSVPARRSLVVGVEPRGLRRTGSLVTRAAKEAGFSESRCLDIARAALDACLEAMEHSPAGGKLAVELQFGPDRLEVSVAGHRTVRLVFFSDGEEARAKTEQLTAMGQRIEILEQLQTAFLDQLPKLPQVDFAYVHQSATSGVQIGGDFYDVFSVGQGCLGFIIGDVSGRGLEACRIALLVKDIMRTFACEHPAPGEVLGRTNRALFNWSIPGFVTGFLGVLEMERGELHYASAAHPPPLLCCGDTVRRLTVLPASPLGAFPDSLYRGSTTRWPGETTLCLYTDGVTEAHDSSGGFYGEEGLGASLLAHTARPLCDLPRLLMHDALAFAGGSIADDAAVLVMRHLARSLARVPRV